MTTDQICYVFLTIFFGFIAFETVGILSIARMAFRQKKGIK